MKFKTFSININPLKPVRQDGHIQQVNKVFKVHDDLNARFLIIEDEFIFIHISTDTLGFNLSFQNELNDKLNKIFDKDVKLVISSTHTHYGGDTNDINYKNQLMDNFIDALTNIELQEYKNLYVSYKQTIFDEVGKSRISNHDAILVLGLLEIYDDNKVISNLINYNTHPTILDANTTDYFSSEFPGYVLSKLKDEFYTYTSGCMGDVSTRFTRSNQTYESVIELGDKLYNKILELKKIQTNKYPLTMSYDELVIPIKHSFNEIELINTNLTDRELETIEYGKIVRQRLKDNPDTLIKEIKMSSLHLNKFNIIFIPNELFSDYLNNVNINNTIISCYSNGYGPYMLPINKKIFTYELFTDTFSNQTKQIIIDQLKKWSSD